MPTLGSQMSNADTTAVVPAFNGTTGGCVPASGGGTTTFLRADGQWVALLVGASKITVGAVAPTSPAVGDLWIDTN